MMKIAKLTFSIFNASISVHTPNFNLSSVIIKIIPSGRLKRKTEKEVGKIVAHWIKVTAATNN